MTDNDILCLISTISFVKVAPNEIKPKPCPFCGSSEIDRRIKRLSTHTLGIRVSCSECSCSINLRYAREQGYFDNMRDSAALLLEERSALLNEAVAAWNKRTGE